MELESLDTTWQVAVDIVQRRLKVPSNMWNLIRNTWSGVLSFDEFVKGLGFCAIDLQFLARASGVEKINGAGELSNAIQRMGLRQATVALAVNYACLKGLKNGPQSRSWQTLYTDLMERVQIGSRLGALVHELGSDGGMLAGFSLRAGHLILLADNPEAYLQLSRTTTPEAMDTKSFELFGCLPSQVGSIVIQQLGFGAAASTGVLLSSLPHSAMALSNPEAEMWQAACTWVSSLADHDKIPQDARWKNYFPSTAGKSPRITATAILTEVREARMAKRESTWHLPSNSYEATEKLVNSWKKTNQYRTVGGRRISVSY